MHSTDRSHLILDVWDYFYCADCPANGDEKAWVAIERATTRIRESEFYLAPRTPPDVRAQHARRVRNSARVALRNIKQLSVQPKQWVLDGLVELEAFGDSLILELSGAARGLAVH
jgi:hypothetical protein